MKKNYIFAGLLIILTLLSACAQTQEAAVLTVGGQEYNQSDLEALGIMSVDYTNKDGETTTYEGVLLSNLLENAGLEGETVVFTAADGYEAEIALDEALACVDCIVAFDEGSLRLVMPEQSSKLQVKDIIQISIN